MTRDDVSRTLRYMENIRERCYEASPREVKRLDAEYGRCWKAIEPYVNGSIPYTEAPSSALETAAWASR